MSPSPPTETGSHNPRNIKPGDEAQAGTPGTGEDICRECNGTGNKKDGGKCSACKGTGRITQAIGGG